MLDFSTYEPDAGGTSFIPIPDGTSLFCEIEVLRPLAPFSGAKSPYYRQGQSGLVGIDFVFHPIDSRARKTRFSGTKIFSWMTMPPSEQVIQLTERQLKACEISARRFSAIMQAAKMPLKIQGPEAFQGAKLWITVGAKENGFNDKGFVKWRYDVRKIILPSDPLFQTLLQHGELVPEELERIQSRPQPATTVSSAPFNGTQGLDTSSDVPYYQDVDQVPF